MKLSFLLLIVFLACQRTTEEPSKIKTITLESEISNPKKVTLSQVVSDIEYVKLEFKPECAIRYLFDVQFSKQYISLNPIQKFINLTGRENISARWETMAKARANTQTPGDLPSMKARNAFTFMPTLNRRYFSSISMAIIKETSEPLIW